MTRLPMLLLIPALLCCTALHAAAEPGQELERERARVEAQAMLEEAERARAEAETMRLDAIKTAEMARETSARVKAERDRAGAERNRIDSEERARERALEQQELRRAREELGRAHRELREATREVARAHRELSLSQVEHIRATERHVNLGDRAVIGVVLGKEKERGIEVIGISPDGPAERAGLQPGDLLTRIAGEDLTTSDDARGTVFEVMSGASDGEELAVTVERDGEVWEYAVIAETREPRGWASVIRIPEVEFIQAVEGVDPVIVERIVVPDIDKEALAERVAELSARVSAEISTRMDGAEIEMITSDGQHHIEHFEFEGYSDLGEQAMREANIWFGLPHAHGLELATINTGLGEYFKTDRGVLVINAKDDNAYQLKSGDVILAIGSSAVNSPSDLMRALRDAEPGEEIELKIKRDRRDSKLTVTMPENRLGFR